MLTAEERKKRDDLTAAWELIQAEEQRMGDVMRKLGLIDKHDSNPSVHLYKGQFLTVHLRSGVGKIFEGHDGKCNLESTSCSWEFFDKTVQRALEAHQKKKAARR